MAGITKEEKESLIRDVFTVQKLLVGDFLRILREGKLAPTDRATIARYLKDNNYHLDASTLPPDLQRILNEMDAASKEPRVMPEP